MTLDVYTQVLQRKDRDLFTEAFDRLMADRDSVRRRCDDPTEDPPKPSDSRIPSS